jgi:hypothetical protein
MISIKYTAREIPFTERIQGREGIRDLILIDYKNFILLSIINLIVLTVLLYKKIK